MVAYAPHPMTRVFGLLRVRWPSVRFPWVTWLDLTWTWPWRKTKRWKCQCWLYCICICICISGLAITDVFPDLNRWGSYFVQSARRCRQHHCIRVFFFFSQGVTPTSISPSRPPTVGLVWCDVGEDDDDKGRVCPDTRIVLCDGASCRVTMQSTLYVAVITIRGCICI